MKFVSTVYVALKKRNLAQLVDLFTSGSCRIKRIDTYEPAEYRNAYECEVVYEELESFSNCIEKLQAYTEAFKFIDVSNSLEKSLNGGLIEISGKLPFDNSEDYEINVLGGAELIASKILEGRALEFSGIENLTANVCAVENTGQFGDRLALLHATAERDSLIIGKFTGLNSIPLGFKFDQPESCLKHLENSSVGFKAMRIFQIENADISFYNYLTEDFPIPILVRELNEEPLYVLSLLVKCSAKHGIDIGETNVGLIGIDNGSVVLTSLLFKVGFRRVLGCDEDAGILLKFEERGGLATIKENILGNADVVIIMKGKLADEDFSSLRPGQFVISIESLSDEHVKAFESCGVKELVAGNMGDMALLAPALLYGMVSGGHNIIEDSLMIALAKRGAKLLSESYGFPEKPETLIDALANEIIIS